MNWEHRTNVRTLRKKANRRLREIVAAARYACHWCGAQIVCVSSIPRADRLRLADGKITFLLPDGGTEVTMAVATLDHVRPISEGGDSGPDNLVASCQRCNNERAKEANGE